MCVRRVVRTIVQYDYYLIMMSQTDYMTPNAGSFFSGNRGRAMVTALPPVPPKLFCFSTTFLRFGFKLWIGEPYECGFRFYV